MHDAADELAEKLHLFGLGYLLAGLRQPPRLRFELLCEKHDGRLLIGHLAGKLIWRRMRTAEHVRMREDVRHGAVVAEDRTGGHAPPAVSGFRGWPVDRGCRHPPKPCAGEHLVDLQMRLDRPELAPRAADEGSRPFHGLGGHRVHQDDSAGEVEHLHAVAR